MANDNIQIFYTEALVKKSCIDFTNGIIYEWILLELQASSEEEVFEKASNYMKQNYNRTYMANHIVTVEFEKILAINPAIDDGSKSVKEIYSIPFSSIKNFELWKTVE